MRTRFPTLVIAELMIPKLLFLQPNKSYSKNVSEINILSINVLLTAVLAKIIFLLVPNKLTNYKLIIKFSANKSMRILLDHITQTFLVSINFATFC